MDQLITVQPSASTQSTLEQQSSVLTALLYASRNVDVSDVLQPEARTCGVTGGSQPSVIYTDW